MRSRRHLKPGAATLVAALAGSLYLTAATFGAGGSAGGAFQLFVTPSLTGKGAGSIIITGAIGDYGRGTKANAAGKPDPSGTYQLATLHYGTILLNATALHKAVASGMEHAHPDLASCSLQGSTSAVLPIVSGTGHYAGISGTARVKFTFAELASRYARGAKKGKCNLSRGPVAEWASVHGTGTVSFK